MDLTNFSNNFHFLILDSFSRVKIKGKISNIAVFLNMILSLKTKLIKPFERTGYLN